MIKYISNNKELLDKLKELEIKNNKINKWKEIKIMNHEIGKRIDEFNSGKELILKVQPEKELKLDCVRGLKLRSGMILTIDIKYLNETLYSLTNMFNVEILNIDNKYFTFKINNKWNQFFIIFLIAYKWLKMVGKC